MYLALAVFLIYKVYRLFGNVAGRLAFFSIWTAFEYIHFNWELSWPFMNLGNWLGQVHHLVQWYEFTGVLGGTLWILLINLFIYLLIKYISRKKYLKASLIFAAGLVMTIVPILISQYLYNKETLSGKRIAFKIIQPNIDPYTEKYNSELFDKQIDSQIVLGKRNDSLNASCYVFPESSFPAYMNEDSCKNNQLMHRLSDELLKNKADMVIGGMYSFRISPSGDSLFYNTAFLLDKENSIKTRHKSKLVVGVEKMPFQDYFGFLKNWNVDFGGYTNSLTIDNEPLNFENKDKSVSIAPIICYESVYGKSVSDFVKKGATCIAVITNDGWWRNSPGYKQHLMHSQLRAIENRRNVVRSANTGTSCIINSKGDLISQIAPFKSETLVGEVSQSNKLSFYTLHGDFLGKIAFWLTVLFVVSLLSVPSFKKYIK